MTWHFHEKYVYMPQICSFEMVALVFITFFNKQNKRYVIYSNDLVNFERMS